jgi:Transglutaminase-like superfamily
VACRLFRTWQLTGLARKAERWFHFFPALSRSVSRRLLTLSKTSPKSRSRLVANWRAYTLTAIFLITLPFGIAEAVSQRRESRYVAEMAQKIIRQANASDETSKIIALRDYLRHNVTRDNYPVEGRPFLRDTAAYSLQTGNGRCGEATRAFVNMAESLGIHSYRLYVEGLPLEHVVALVQLSDGRQLVVDSTDRPYIQDLIELNQLPQYHFNYYTSINMHRWLRRPSLPANTYDPPGLSYFYENPHALKALLWFSLSFAGLALWGLRRTRRYFRGRRTVTVPALPRVGKQSPAIVTADR